MEAKDILKSDYLDILFEGRNKQYGAYDLRRTYTKRLGIALLISAGLAALLIGGSLLQQALAKGNALEADDLALKNRNEKKKDEKKIVEKKKEEKKIEKPKVKMKQVVVPIPKPDNQVKEPPPPQNEDDKRQAGAEDIKKGLDKIEIEVEKMVTNPAPSEPEPVEKEVVDMTLDTETPATWRKHLERVLQRAVTDAAESGAEPKDYVIMVRFSVDENGNPTNAVVEEGTKDYGFREAAIDAINNGPKWKIARNSKGEPTPSLRRQSITFRVQEAE
jgi:periplasmic protein TonB